jgi:hypothetical protein
MWPWGHAAFGYVLYSLGSRALRREPPTGASVLVLLFATQLPDLVDKTLSWVFGVFPTGYSVAHSVFVAVPVGLAVLAVAAWRGRVREGAAFVVGYWSHLVGDVIVAVVAGIETDVERVLWPLVTLPAYETEYGAIERVLVYFFAFLDTLSTAEQLGLLAVYFGPVLAAFVLWLLDGAPGVRPLRKLFDPNA